MGERSLVFRNKEDSPQKMVFSLVKNKGNYQTFFFLMKMCHLNVKNLYSCLSDHPVNVISGGECHEDDINELVKEDEVDGEEETQKTKGTKRKAESVLAR